MSAYGDVYHLPKMHRDVPICHRNTLKVSALLVFADGQELAKCSRQRQPRLPEPPCMVAAFAGLLWLRSSSSPSNSPLTKLALDTSGLV